MLDQFGRKIEYMRISLTNNCNLRCSYCMPEKRISDVHFFPMNQVLRCVESAVSLGITHFRLTGGEPLCYPKIEELLCKIKQIKGVDSVHLTTNGVLLKEKAAQLKQAGIDSINVSLDTPDEKEYRVLTGGGKLSNVLDGIRKAAELEIPVKINAVLREQTDVCALAAFAEQNHVTLRFIEMMPIGFGKILPVDPKSKVLETLQERYGRYERIMQRKRKADYQEKVDKSLKSFRQKAQIPGFRKGMVPMSLVKKMYGKSALAEEVNKLLSETVYKYIQDNKVNILGEPLPNEDKQQEIDFDTMEEFEFLFDIALAPEFKAEVSAKDKVDYYTIEVTDEMVDNQVKAYTQRNGKYDKVDVYEDNDMLKGLLAELDEEGNTKEGGIQVEGAVMMPSYMKNDEQKAIFAGAKVNDVLVFNPNTAWDGNAAELSSLLKIDKEAAPEVKSNFSFQVEEITRFVPGDLTQEIFDQVFGEGNVKTEEEFRAKVKEVIANQFVADSDYKFLIDARKMLTEKVGKLEFPDALLKRIMRLNNPDKEESFVEDNYDKSIEELTWHLIKEQLVKANDIKVEQEDITNMAKEATRAQFAQYGMMSVPEEILENYSKEMLKKKESIEGLVNRVVESKLATALKSQVELEHKNVSAEEFNKMFA